MSEKSFAVASVSVAIVWGTFFYPPAPHQSGANELRPAITDSDSAPPARVQHAAVVLAPAKPGVQHAPPQIECAPGVINRTANCSIAQN